jgi:hypothetical protein
LKGRRISLEISAQDLIGKVSIAVIQPEVFSLLSLQIVIKMAKELDMEGIYVSANKPYSTVEEELKNSGVLDKIVFVDCASGLAGEHPIGDKVLLIENPADLTNLSIIVSNSIKMLSMRGFLLFDSLSTLLIYTPMETLTKFAHTLGLKLKSSKMTSLLLAVDQEAGKEVVNFLSTIADRILYLTIDEEGKIRKVK